jgi:hypothetical protein
MTLNLPKLLLGFVLLISITSFSTVANASDWDRETIFTFSQPVRVPGRDLPAGTYVWRLMDDSSDRNVVEVFTADRKHLVAAFMTIEQLRSKAIDHPLLTLTKGPAGTPEAVDTWYFGGDFEGVQLLYPKRNR